VPDTRPVVLRNGDFRIDLEREPAKGWALG